MLAQSERSTVLSPLVGCRPNVFAPCVLWKICMMLQCPPLSSVLCRCVQLSNIACQMGYGRQKWYIVSNGLPFVSLLGNQVYVYTQLSSYSCKLSQLILGRQKAMHAVSSVIKGWDRCFSDCSVLSLGLHKLSKNQQRGSYSFKLLFLDLHFLWSQSN